MSCDHFSGAYVGITVQLLCTIVSLVVDSEFMLEEKQQQKKGT